MQAQRAELDHQRRLAIKANPLLVHKGWRVSGIQHGEQEEAKQALLQCAPGRSSSKKRPSAATIWLSGQDACF